MILTCFNRREKTRASLRNLFDQAIPQGLDFEVFLCDDNSTDGTGEMLAGEFPRVRVAKGNGRLFWGGGMRKAWSFAKESGKFDAYLWLNDDTLLLPNAFADLLGEFESIGRPAIVAAACKSPGSEEFSYGGHHQNMCPLPPNGTLQEVHYINGNFVLIPREVEEKIGMISDRYTHFLGDFDYGIRAKKAGFPLYTTFKYLAECESNPMPDWADPALSLRKRWKMAHDVKGRAISEYIAFKSYHYGKLVGFKSWIDVYLKLIFTDRYVAFRDLLFRK